MSKDFTRKGGTETTEGWIPHKKHPAGFLMPAKVMVDLKNKKQPPIYRDNRLVFALPGGKEFIS